MAINEYDTGTAFVNRFISASHAVHPLEMIYEVLKIYPHYTIKSSINNKTYQIVSSYVNSVKDSFDNTMLKAILDDFLRNNPYQYFANSVLIQANKIWN